MKYLIAFGIVIILKFVLNAWRLHSIKKMKNMYVKCFNNEHMYFSEYIALTKKLIEDASLAKTGIPTTSPIGYGQIVAMNALIVDNLDVKRGDIIVASVSLMERAMGVFKMRMFESISPIYWIEVIIFLPKNIVRYLGGNKDSAFSKILQIIYWVATPLLITFRTDFYEFLRMMFEQAK